MISLKDLENSKKYIISNSKKEDQDILKFLESYGYTPIYSSNWYENFKSKYNKVCFIITKFHSVDIKIAVDTDIYYHLNEIQEYVYYIKDKIKSASDIIAIRDENIGYNTKKFNALYEADFNFNYKENKMELLKIYKDRKMDKLFKEADKGQSKAWEKNSTYKTLKDLSEKTKTKDGYLFNFNFIFMPDSVREEIDKIHKDKEEKEIQLNRLINEVEAQLAECETYEQKINVLKAYEILDEKGKVNA